MFFKKNRYKFILLLCSLMGVQTALAANQPNHNSLTFSGQTNYLSSPVFSLSGGPLWSQAIKSQTFYLAPEIEKTYAASTSTQALVNGEVFLGLRQTLNETLNSQLGLAVATTSDATLSGHIWDDADPEFNNYTYRYKIKNTHIALKGKLLADWQIIVIPWISGSIGVGFNNAHFFTNQPTVYEAEPTANFSSETKTALTYTLGTGVQHALTKNWQIGVGYEFADWGKSQLGRASGQTESGGLSLSHFYTNGFLLNITYLP